MPRDVVGYGVGVVDNGKMKTKMKMMTCTLWGGYHSGQSIIEHGELLTRCSGRTCGPRICEHEC